MKIKVAIILCAGFGKRLMPLTEQTPKPLLKINKIKYKNKTQFINDFEILSVLRNLKIIGIFTRLANRDKKKKYLKLIPVSYTHLTLPTTLQV